MRPVTRRVLQTAKAAIIGGAAGFGSFFIYTRKDDFVPMLARDPIFQLVDKRNWNPHRNPTTHDFFVRRVSLNEIRPELREQPEKLTEAFCAGVWSNWGFFAQRTLLSVLARNHSNRDHLWSRDDFLVSNYQPGTLMADSFEVLQKTANGIVVRGGGSPSEKGVRPLDAILELTATIIEEEQVAEFGFKSIFFTGNENTGRPPFPGLAVWLHLQYAKLLLETGILNVIVS